MTRDATTPEGHHRRGRERLVPAPGPVVLLATAALVVAGSGATLPTPPADPSELGTWWRTHPPVLAAAGLLRIVACALVAHLVVLTLAGLAGAVLRSPTLVALARRAAPPTWAEWLRPLAVVAALSAAPGSASATTPTTAAVDVDPLPDRMRRLPADATAWRLTPLDEAPATDAGTGSSGPDAPASPPVATPATTTVDPDASGWRRVRADPGDSMWSLAADRLAEHLGRPPTAAEVTPYWRDVIAANAATHPDPGWVLVGDTLRLPPPGT